jgi:hypothetical protein
MKGKSGDFLLDTGGGVTLLTEQFSKGIECEFWGRTTGFNMFGKRGDGPHCDNVQIMAGEVALTPVNVGKIDFEGQFPGDVAPDGLLSLDAFDGKAITLDQQAGTLTIETPKSLLTRTRVMKELAFRISRECSARCLSAFVGVPTSKGMTWLILDSGAGGVSLISKDHAKLFGLDPNVKEQRLKHEVAPGVSIDSPALVTDMIMDGNLGQPTPIQFLHRHVSADWGELSEEDVQENERSLREGFRLLSAYRTAKGQKMWIITEADRSATTILLPSEY